MPKKKTTTFEFKKLKKGLHIKIDKKYYKYNGKPTEIDAIIAYHNSNKKTSLQQIKKSYEQASLHLTTRLPRKTHKTTKYIKQQLKKRKIHEHYKPGISTIRITNIQNKTPTQLQAYTEKLLQKLVLDKQLLHILNQEHNLQKIKSRLHTQLQYQENNKTLATSDVFNHTPIELLQKIHQKLKKGQIIDYNTLENTLPNWNNNKLEDGTLTHINATIHLRKG